MGVRILENSHGECCFYCATSMWAFGPVMEDYETAEAFLKWLPEDPHEYKDIELHALWGEFLKETHRVAHKTARFGQAFKPAMGESASEVRRTPHRQMAEL
jgi:hypothetical protein